VHGSVSRLPGMLGAASSQDAQKQMQGESTAAQQAEGARTDGRQGLLNLPTDSRAIYRGGCMGKNEREGGLLIWDNVPSRRLRPNPVRHEPHAPR
jgi:type II secretory pathway pseudopilin PulG